MDIFLDRLCQSWSELRPNSQLNENPLLFGRYRAETIIGVGGTSIVLSAHDTNLRRLVAIKIWNPYTGAFARIWDDARNFDNQIEYFRQEAQKLASLKHPNLCEIYDFGVDSHGVPWVVMEFFKGVTLRERLHQWLSGAEPHNIATIISIAKQLVSAVDLLHRNKLYQLDIKPENILVKDGSIKLIDIASSLDKSAGNFSKDHLKCGTPGYIAPEVINISQSKYISPASDVFSIGATLLEMCCLQNPLASEELCKLAYEGAELEERDSFLDLRSLVFIQESVPIDELPFELPSIGWELIDVDDSNRQVESSTTTSSNLQTPFERWRNLYIEELAKLNIYNIFNSISFKTPQTLVDLIAKMMKLTVSERPRNAGEVLKGLSNIESHLLNATFKDASAEVTEQIAIYRQQSADLTEIVKLQAIKPIHVEAKTVVEQSRKVEVEMNFHAPVTGATGTNRGIININAPEEKQTLAEAAAEIQRLLKQLEETNPTATEPEQVTYINLATKPDFKQRTIAALKAAGETAIDEFFLENKYLKVGKAIVKGWLQPNK
jgi:serine/threonine protein kinase